MPSVQHAARLRVAIAAAVAATMPFAALAAPGLTHSTVLTDLEEPWDMAFLPDGTMFFTEKCRGLSVMTADGDVRPLFGMGEAEGFALQGEDLFCEGQAGMNGVAVDPDFDANRHVYVYSASSMTAPGSNRVIRLTVGDDLDTVADRTDIIDDIPYKPEATDQPFGGPGAHNGGRIRFSPDGHLFVTTGDTHNPDVPQSPTLLGGKVLRVDRDGQAVEGNGAPEGFDPRIYTYGHRNVQGIAFRPGTGQPVVSEHGPWHSDEITALVPGGNGGWDPRPNVAGRSDCPDGYCGYEPNQMDAMDPAERAEYMPMTDLEAYPDAMVPAWENNGLSQGTSSAAFLEGEKWGDWDGRMVVGLLGIGFGGTEPGQRIDVIDLAEDGLSTNDVTTMDLPMEPGRFRAVVLGPDGDLYAAIDEGDIYRITPE
ncbi:PQQ-dependent sugar dehydrogenase [Paracoccus aestuarii]|uniref:PQQ-dependent sugar dehydrogenase n=1 Tax=Paracoccus aestuarii TaxID=453842 RepID=A0A419A116_9RHOB|nr:PQQ-dependent sugar dehydrogenase [Paracoccus aestuarii]RJL06653.1 PQQ-dependent sugar dehydrogenase [Paracoccus aestuarii]WCR00911.1 PQQ-dependent sugar dehydrogenase [Paracoccus aestuarii]